MATYPDVYTTAYSDTYGDGAWNDAIGLQYTDTYGYVYGTLQAAPGLGVALLLGATWDGVGAGALSSDGAPTVTITRGRADETTQASPASLAVTFNNRDGRFSPRNPLGPWYGLLGRNTPVRVSVAAMEPYLRIEDDAQSGATIPDANPLDITGGIDVRIDVRPSSYQPCVLASKWLGLVTVPSTTPAVPGAIVFKADVANSSSQLKAGQTFDGWLGGTRTPAMNAQRIYHNVGDFSNASSDDIALLGQKCQLVVSWKPALNGSDWTALSASISSYVTAAAAAGAPVPLITFHHEPQNSHENLTAAQFINMMRTYYPLSKAAYPQVPVIYIGITTGGGDSAIAAYYPGDAYCDGLYQDLYADMWKNGADMATLVSIASAASPPKPIGNGEIGFSVSAKHPPSNTDFANFMAYIAKVYTTQAANGLPCGACMLWDGFATGDISNFTGPSDPRMTAIKSWYDALASTASGGGGTAAQRSWALVLNGDGTLGFWWTSDGTLATVQKVNSTLPVPLGRQTIRVLAQFTGAKATLTFYTAGGGNADNTGTGPPWVQLGTPITGLSLKMFSSSAPVVIGYNSAVTADYSTYGGLTGAVSDFELRSFTGQYTDMYSDIYGATYAGLTVAQGAFAGQPAGTENWADAYGNAWATTGTAEISDRDYRFHGEMSSLPVTWDASTTDITAPVQAGGLLRRLSQGSQPPVYSAFKRAVLSAPVAPVAYWPMEDGATATTFGSAVGDPAMTFSGAPTLAADTAFACSAALPQMGNALCLGNIGPYTGGTGITAGFLLHIPVGVTTADDTVLCRVNTSGSIGDFTLRYKTGGQLRLSGYSDALAGFAFDTGALSQFSLTGTTVLVNMSLQPAGGGTVRYTIATLAAGSTAATTVTGTFSGSVGNALLAHLGAASTMAMGHLYVLPAYVAITTLASPLAAWAGETCAQRFARLCGENGYAARVYGYPATDVPMGVQMPDTLVNLLTLCETTGRGQMYEARQARALGYRTVRSLCQQPPALALDYSQQHLDALAPTDDDQTTVNDVTVTNGSGSTYETTLNDGSAMSVSPPPAGVGDYGNSYTVNASADAQLASIAGWILHTGTVNEERYPTIGVDLMNRALAGLIPAAQALDVGGHLQVLNVPSRFLPPGTIKQLVYGISETIGIRVWQMSWNCVPESPYETAIVGDPVYGHADTDGSVLDADVTALGTSTGFTDVYNDTYGAAIAALAVDTTGPSGILWTTNPADCPFDVLMGGEQITVLAVWGTSSPQTFTVIRSVNGVVKAHSAGEAIKLAHPAIVALA